MEKIRLGVLGSANIAHRHIIPALTEVDNIELVAIASRNKDTAEALSLEYGCDGEYGYGNLVTRSDIDAVYIPLPVGLHYDWTKRCLNEDKLNLQLEWPMSRKVEKPQVWPVGRL